MVFNLLSCRVNFFSFFCIFICFEIHFTWFNLGSQNTQLTNSKFMTVFFFLGNKLKPSNTNILLNNGVNRRLKWVPWPPLASPGLPLPHFPFLSFPFLSFCSISWNSWSCQLSIKGMTLAIAKCASVKLQYVSDSILLWWYFLLHYLLLLPAFPRVDEYLKKKPLSK